jgi:hypothetical protein
MKKTETIVNKVYKLKGDKKPLAFMLTSRHTHRKPLLHFDGKVNRSLRYASNQKSPFEDEQDNNVILSPIIFEDGLLLVKKENQILQHFLSLHPENGQTFEEVNKEADAQGEIDTINLEADALIAARSMDISQMEIVARVMLDVDPEKLSSAELKRDMMILAKRYPADFLEAIEDPEMDVYSTVTLILQRGLLGLRNNGRNVHYNLKNNKKRMMTVPFGEDPKSAIAAYLQSDEGLDVLKLLESHLE